MWVLCEALVKPAKPRIRVNLQLWCEHTIAATDARLVAHGRADHLKQTGVPAIAHVDRRRKDRAATGPTVQPFDVNRDRDPVPAVIDHCLLQEVLRLLHVLEARITAGQPRAPGPADTSAVVEREDCVGRAEGVEQLRHLLVRIHAREQVGNARIHWLRRVTVQRLLGLPVPAVGGGGDHIHPHQQQQRQRQRSGHGPHPVCG